MLLPSHPRRIQGDSFGQDGDRTHPLSHSVAENGAVDESSLGSSIPPHPLGIKPLGNKYISTVGDARNCIGSLRGLPDEMLMQLLEYLDPRTLRLLGYTCKFLFACCMSDDIWKTTFLE